MRIRRANPQLNVQRQHVTLWTGQGTPCANHLAALAAALGVTMEDFFEDDGKTLDDIRTSFQSTRHR
jgi:transcriptional regulator with XRE-family HTH domain